MMRKYLIILFFISFAVYGQNCSMLKEGLYRTHYEGQTENFQEFEIVKGEYHSRVGDVIKKFKIKMLNECSFQIVNDDVIEDSELSEFQKVIRKQEYYFKIEKVENDNYYFTCIVDLHVICGNGKFVKILNN